MHRFFVSTQNINGASIVIPDKAALHHIKDVLRFKAGDKVIAFDERGNEYHCAIKQLSGEVILDIRETFLARQKKERFNLAIACAIPKKAKMEDIIDKLTQLGVHRIIPLKTERVVVKLDAQKELKKAVRWRKIALCASEQCQRNNLPVIDKIREIKEVLSEPNTFDLKLIPTLCGKRKLLKEILLTPGYKNILVIIGPEGDFTQQEVELAKDAGFIPVSLGGLVLPVDTAAIAIASYIKLSY